MKNGKILYSQDISENIYNFTKKKVKDLNIQSFFLANNDIYIILRNSLKVKMSIDGKEIDVEELKTKINTDPILINGSILYIDKKEIERLKLLEA